MKKRGPLSKIPPAPRLYKIPAADFIEKDFLRGKVSIHSRGDRGSLLRCHCERSEAISSFLVEIASSLHSLQ